MTDKIKIFENAQFGQIRTSKTESGEPLFCLADICKALDLQAAKVKLRLPERGVYSIHTPTYNQYGAVVEQELNFITEPNLYKCIFQSRKKEAERFQDWVCEEVLPAIRRTGGYMAARPDESPEDIMARALVIAQETISRQQERIDAMAPGARFAKALETSKKSILIGELAKILRQNGIDIGQNRLFQWLRDKGYLCSRGEAYNLPSQKAMDMELFEVKKTLIQRPHEDDIVTTTTKVTGKGQVYFVNKFLGVC